MNKIIYGLIIINLMSCKQVNSTGEKTVTQGEDTISSINISTSKIDTLHLLSESGDENKRDVLFKASGIEPGWYLEMSLVKLKLILNYGKDSLLIKDDL